jgi:hypothetical protein
MVVDVAYKLDVQAPELGGVEEREIMKRILGISTR